LPTFNSKFYLILILLLATFWRFANYPSRWVLNQDQARDATIALYSIRNHTLPLVGSPSSAGAFNFGPAYDYLIAFFSIILPFDSGPWIGFTLLSLLTVYLFYLIGTALSTPCLGLIMSLLSAVSVELVSNSPDMLNTVIVAFGVTLTLYFVVKFLVSGSLKFAFLIGLGGGFTLQQHFQSLGLSTLLATSLLFRKNIKSCFLALISFFLSLAPLIYFDLTHNLVWIKSVIYYYTIDVHKFWAPTSWRIDLGTFWPHLFGQVTVGSPLFGYFLIFLILSSYFLFLISKSRFQILDSRFLIPIALSFLLQILLLRYYPGTRSREYLIAFHPFVIFFTGLALFIISQKSKPLFLVLISCFLVLSTLSNLKTIQIKSQAPLIYSLKSKLDSQIPGPISLYSDPNSNMLSLPIFYLLYRQNRISDTGTPILACINCQSNGQLIAKESLSPTQTYYLYLLQSPNIQDPGSKIYPLTSRLIFSWLYINYQ
jgi:hypothetical protein